MCCDVIPFSIMSRESYLHRKDKEMKQGHKSSSAMEETCAPNVVDVILER
jgi:hypothetical protein